MTRISGREAFCVGFLVAGLLAALVIQAWRVGVTVDEPAHLLSAHLYWLGQDNLQPRDLPPLIKLVGGWPSLFLRPDVPYDSEIWKTRNEWLIAGEMVDRTRFRLQRLFFISRLPLLVFPLLSAVLIWWWGRQLFSPSTGVLLAMAFALEPTALAHGALFKNDLAATFTFLLFWYAAWRFWGDPRPRRWVLLGTSLALAALAKVSLLILAPAAPAIVAIRYCVAPHRSMRRLALAPLVVLGIAYGTVLAGGQFSMRRVSAAEILELSADEHVPGVLSSAAAIFRLIPAPAPLWDATVSLARSNSRDDGWVYALGKNWDGGQPWYFLLALAVKVPVALQALLALGVWLLPPRVRSWSASNIFWLLPGVLYLALASMSNLQLGVRLILPALPFGLLLCGPAIEWMAGRRRLVLGVLFLWLAGVSMWVYPHGIAFFNVWTGGPENGLHYLADSNLDWGQALGEVARYCHDHQIQRIRLSYWGWDSPFRYFRENEVEIVPPPWEESLARGRVWRPEPGWYAISAALLPGYVFQDRFRNYYEVFREMTPVAKAGYAIYIYRIGGTRASGGG